MLIKYIEKLQLILGVICLSIFLIAILIQVFSRYLGIPMIWTEEVANFSFIWAVFMGASVMVRSKSHFRFNLLSQKLKGKAKIIVDIVVNIIILIFSILILNYGIRVTKTFWNYRWVTLSYIKMGYTWIIIPIMGATMSIYSVEHIVNDIKKFIKNETLQEEDIFEKIKKEKEGV